jgi:catechol 2,3-dioxygenase-like lactoylglutathione lyase family enzyme
MINGTHAMVYVEDADAARAFFRDVLEFPHVDDGDGWLIFRLPPAEMGVHPVDPAESGQFGLYLTCDDIHDTVATLRDRGVEFASDVMEMDWGLLISMRIPGGATMGLYEPRHATTLDAG